MVSPADFSLSVHHALIGLLSIARQNTQGHTALAAGEDSFFMALLESAALLAENPDQDVLIIHCDEPLTGSFKIFNEAEEKPVVLVVLVTAKQGVKYSLRRSATPESGEVKINHPRDFINFLENKNERIFHSIGQYNSWHIKRHA